MYIYNICQYDGKCIMMENIVVIDTISISSSIFDYSPHPHPPPPLSILIYYFDGILNIIYVNIDT